MSGLTVILLFFSLLFLGIPVAYSMSFVSALYMIFSDIPLMTLIQRMANSPNSVTLLAIPAFLLAGSLMNNGGLTKSLFKAVNATPIGKLKGGLAYVNVLASLIFSGMSGAALADLGGLGKIEMEAMKENGYEEDDALAITLASSAIGPIFPPSIQLLIFAMVANVSGVRILLAGVFPGILMAFALLLQVAYFAHKKNFPRGVITGSFKDRMFLQFKGIPALLAPVILLAGLLLGTYSPTELASVATVYSLCIGVFVYKGITKHNFIDSLRTSVKDVANILFIGAAAIAFSYVLTIEQVPLMFQNLLTSVTDNWILLIIITNVILIIVGMFMDSFVAYLIFTPIIMPALVSVGLDPIHVGILMCLNLVIGFYTPPFGTLLFMASIMTKIPFARIVKAMAPYYIPLILALLAVSFFPQISLWLPNFVFNR
ncbi:MAG: TRAP transporter large permease [Spirochaetales bacterium]